MTQLNDNREYFALLRDEEKLSLNRLGSFENPGMAIQQAQRIYTGNLVTVLSARCVGIIDGIRLIFQMYCDQDVIAINIWKHMSKGMLIGWVSLPPEKMASYKDGYIPDANLKAISGQECIELKTSEVDALLKTIGVSAC